MSPYAAAGLPVVLIAVAFFCDDMKANRSKVHKGLDAWELIVANMPQTANTKLDNIHTLCLSEKASPGGMQVAIADDMRVSSAAAPHRLLAQRARSQCVVRVTWRTHVWERRRRQLLEKGVVAYDAHLATKVTLTARVFVVLADNPRQSELVNHRGTRAVYFCRYCFVRSAEDRTDAMHATTEAAATASADIRAIDRLGGRGARGHVAGHQGHLDRRVEDVGSRETVQITNDACRVPCRGLRHGRSWRRGRSRQTPRASQPCDHAIGAQPVRVPAVVQLGRVRARACRSTIPRP